MRLARGTMDETSVIRLRRRLPTLLLPFVTISLGACATGSAATHSSTAGLVITQEFLVPLCLDGNPVDSGQRRWRLAPGQHVMRFTMRNAPRVGAGGLDVEAGDASVTFTLEAGGKYEVEVRAPGQSYARRVWAKGEWIPAVRQRNPDRIVSGEAVWENGPCRRP